MEKEAQRFILVYSVTRMEVTCSPAELDHTHQLHGPCSEALHSWPVSALQSLTKYEVILTASTGPCCTDLSGQQMTRRVAGYHLQGS